MYMIFWNFKKFLFNLLIIIHIEWCLYIYTLVWKEGIWYFSYILQGELPLLYTRQT